MSFQSGLHRIEDFTGIKYPKFLKDILVACGFENEASLEIINDKIIKDIENSISGSENLQIKLKGTSYVKKDGALISHPFKFLIGHKLLLLKIPTIISEYKKKKNSFDSDNWKETLLKKIENYIIKKKLQFTVTLNHIKSSSITQNRAKVQVKCVFCEKEVPCTFNRNWSISNYMKHVLKHKKLDNKTSKNTNKSVTASATTSATITSTQIQRADEHKSTAVLSEVLR